MDVRVWMFEKKKNMLDGHTKGQDNEKSITIKRSVMNFSHSLPHDAQFHSHRLFYLKSLFREMV